eukprot:PhM_4_TR3333/c1_g3_i1/m.84168/K18156/ATP23, XRCC6BP1; mitochondrial inner membrane protease ATP23
MEQDECTSIVQSIMKDMNTITYLVDSIQQLGRTFNETMVKCVRSPSGAEGPADAGYLWQDTPRGKRGEIVLFHDLLPTEADIERTLRHELVHAFDDARAKIEPTNCYHHACSEVRAARLSGECLYTEEVRRGHYNPAGCGMDCVRRRAALAVNGNTFCRGFGERSVEKVFAACYRDYEPFVAPLYTMGEYPTVKVNNKVEEK